MKKKSGIVFANKLFSVAILCIIFCFCINDAVATTSKLSPSEERDAIKNRNLSEQYLMSKYADKCIFLSMDYWLPRYAFVNIYPQLFVGRCITILSDSQFGKDRPYYAYIEIDPKNEVYRPPNDFMGITALLDNNEAIKMFFDTIRKGLRQTFKMIQELSPHGEIGEWKILVDELGMIDQSLKGQQEKLRKTEEAKSKINSVLTSLVQNNTLANCKLGLSLISNLKSADTYDVTIGCLRDDKGWFGLFKKCEFIICSDNQCNKNETNASVDNLCDSSAKNIYAQHVKPYILSLLNSSADKFYYINIYNDEYGLFDLVNSNLQ